MMRAAVLLLLFGCGSVAAAPDAGGSMRDASPMRDAPEDTSGLVARYEMDTATFPVVSDTTRHHDGTCSSAQCPSLTMPGRIGAAAYLFDGVDDMIRIPSSDELKTMQGFTITAWINRTPGGGAGCAINKGLGSMEQNSWQACINASGALAFFSANATAGHAQTNNKIIEPGQWHHIALWWNGSAMTKATYIDGALEVSEGGVTIDFDDSDVTIGSDIDDGVTPKATFDGSIDDVRIYNRPLSVTEIGMLQAP